MIKIGLAVSLQRDLFVILFKKIYGIYNKTYATPVKESARVVISSVPTVAMGDA